MMDNKIKNLWRNIRKHGKLLESYSKVLLARDGYERMV